MTHSSYKSYDLTIRQNESRPGHNLTAERFDIFTITMYRIILFGNDRNHTNKRLVVKFWIQPSFIQYQIYTKVFSLKISNIEQRLSKWSYRSIHCPIKFPTFW